MCYRLIFILILLISTLKVSGQSNEIRKEIIKGISNDLIWSYVSYDVAKEMMDYINHKFESGGYDTLLNIDEFTYEITKDLRNISHDEHVYVGAPHAQKHIRYISKPFKFKKSGYRSNHKGEIKKKFSFRIYGWIYNVNLQRQKNKLERRLKKDMFRYGQIKILPGNIGYLEIFNFEGASFKSKDNKDRIKFKSVMRFLQNTNSIIIDLRANTGGYIALSNYFVSFFVNKPNGYFITSERAEVKDTIPMRRDTIYIKDYRIPKQNNYKYAQDKDLYILTSHSTFSAAELTTYALKKLTDATIIGEQTRGGGHAHSGPWTTPYYQIVVPSTKIIDKENNNFSFENRGISPDSLVNSFLALEVAYDIALKKASEYCLQKEVKYFKGEKDKKITYSKQIQEIMTDYVGDYRKIQVEIINEKLYLKYDKSPPQLLIAKTKDYFKSDDYSSIKFIRNDENKVTEIQIKCFCGEIEKYRRLQ